jgi:predicted ester cyclase
MVAEADKVAMRFRVTGINKGNGPGFPTTRRTIDLTGMMIIQFANGKLVHGWNNWMR